jgi:Uma2 family endonuclease
MESVAVAERMTAEQYLALEPSDSDPPRSELIDGEVVVNAPRWRHQKVTGELFGALREWARAQAGRGQAILAVDVQLDKRNVFEPDILWYAQDRVPADDTEPPSPLPDLAVEVRSPSTWRYDIGAKKSGYERHGLPELWLVDTAADEVLAFRRSAPGAPSFDTALELARGDTLKSPLLPGFALRVDELFAER